MSLGLLRSSGFENYSFSFCLEETNEHMQIYFAELEFYIIKYTIELFLKL